MTSIHRSGAPMPSGTPGPGPVAGSRVLDAGERVALTRQGLSRFEERDRFVMNRTEFREAQAFASATHRHALADGVVSPQERQLLDAARRDAHIAALRTELDEVKKSLGELEVGAARDSVLTPDEAARIAAERARLESIGGALRRPGSVPSIDPRSRAAWMQRHGRDLI